MRPEDVFVFDSLYAKPTSHVLGKRETARRYAAQHGH